MNGDCGFQAANQNGLSSQPLDQIQQALEIVYNPQSSRDTRDQAGAFLEATKTAKEAPFHGFTLAHNTSLNPYVRYFGLQCLEHSVRYGWAAYSESEGETVRGWILNLAQGVLSSDPLYIRNKIAQLWVEVAKRAWGDSWLNMDELLVKLWENASREPNPAQRDLVLFILETLVDDVFNREDPAAGLRNGILSKACFDIFTPHGVFREFYPHRADGTVPRCGEEGWLLRLTTLLGQALDAGVGDNEEVKACCLRILTVLKACMGWSIPK